jgi:hypothetical protein
MNPTAILGLISDLYSQLTAAQDRISVLEDELANARATSDGDGETRSPRRAPVASAGDQSDASPQR